VVDGNDLFAVYGVTARAVARARSGDGPTLIESVTRRLGPHNTADDPTRYADPAEDERWRALDPIASVERYLRARDERHAARIAAFDDDVAAEIERALADAGDPSDVSADQLFAHVYAEPPVRLERQRARRSEHR
jgi:pyruvate dehydrogenase E1 component alpha subunit